MPTPTDLHDAPQAEDAVRERPEPQEGAATDPTGRQERSAHKAPMGDDPYIGAVVADRYRILRMLGEGGMGAVYLAEHTVIEKKIALKILSQDFARKADLVHRFIQEARAAARIGHENIIEVTDFGETASQSVFIAMEYLEGRDLAQVIREQAPLPIPRVRHIAVQICRALQAAHAKQIVHRDLKPENIFLIEREGRPDFVKVLDFGIAKISTAEEERGRLTRTGMIFGTPEYMSPEQARGEDSDHRVDIYAMGVLLYEMLTGTVPFSADSFMGVLTKQMFEPVEPPSRRLGAPLPRDIEEICLRALEKDRERRFPSMQAMAQALEGEPLSPPLTSGAVPVYIPEPGRSQRVAPPATQTGPMPTLPPSATSGIPGQMPATPPGSGPVLMAAPPGLVPRPYGAPGYDDQTTRSGIRLPRRRRLLAVLTGAAIGLLILAVLLLRGRHAGPTSSGSTLVASEEPPPPHKTVPSVPPVVPPVKEPAAEPPRPRATLLLSGTPGAQVEVWGSDRGRLPARGVLPVPVDLPVAGEVSVPLLVHKRDFVNDARNVVLSPGREVALEINLQARSRRAGRGQQLRAPPRPEETARPAQKGSELRDPFQEKR